MCVEYLVEPKKLFISVFSLICLVSASCLLPILLKDKGDYGILKAASFQTSPKMMLQSSASFSSWIELIKELLPYMSAAVSPEVFIRTVSVSWMVLLKLSGQIFGMQAFLNTFSKSCFEEDFKELLKLILFRNLGALVIVRDGLKPVFDLLSTRDISFCAILHEVGILILLCLAQFSIKFKASKNVPNRLISLKKRRVFLSLLAASINILQIVCRNSLSSI